jgi:ABC-type transport system involved in multi-copper enzyme maturation permease subunit
MRMLHLLKIDLKKLTSYRTFWVVGGLYFITLAFATASGMEFLKLLARLIEGLGEKLNISRIPLYHFPDVWMNLIWFSGLFKVVLAIMVVISVTNEFSYRTIRQNVIDGLSREQFLLSKIYTNVLLSLMSVVMIFVIGLITGLIYSPADSLKYIFIDLEFFPAYFLEIFFFLSYALMISLLVQRSGLTIILLLLSQMIELIITANIDDELPWLIPYFPMRSVWNLIDWPLPRYAFQEIKDYLEVKSVLIVMGWTILFNYFSYLKLKKADI